MLPEFNCDISMTPWCNQEPLVVRDKDGRVMVQCFGVCGGLEVMNCCEISLICFKSHLKQIRVLFAMPVVK